jgi:RNA polymerase sigma factor (TIGR02999 family)
LVNELYLKLVAWSPIGIENRAHFFALAAKSLRRILVDYARLHTAKKRGGNGLKITLSSVEGRLEANIEDILGVHEALLQFQELDPRAAQSVELRFFGGLNEQEVAQALGISKNTVQRDWRTARAWLTSRLQTHGIPRQQRNV